MIYDSGLGDVVTCIPYLPHAESISELLSAHALYLTIGAGEGETISTGKLYEYLGARKPIIASAPSCEAAWTIEETKSGRVFHPEDNEGLAQEILRLYTLHKDGRLNGPSLEAVQRYDRQRLARELARHLSEVA
jgi:glycosyltransferase involved in cell wall biosynthesis